jgi:hypothetical protein
MPALPECDMLKPWPVKEVADLIVGQQKIRELLQKQVERRRVCRNGG